MKPTDIRPFIKQIVQQRGMLEFNDACDIAREATRCRAPEATDLDVYIIAIRAAYEMGYERASDEAYEEACASAECE